MPTQPARSLRRQLHRREVGCPAARHRSLQPQHVETPRVKLAPADAVTKRHLAPPATGLQAVDHDLALALVRPSSATVGPDEDFDPGGTTALTNRRKSVIRIDRRIEGRNVHPRPRSQNVTPGPDGRRRSLRANSCAGKRSRGNVALYSVPAKPMASPRRSSDRSSSRRIRACSRSALRCANRAWAVAPSSSPAIRPTRPP